ncbi:uncharacterized protein HaLaN_20919 [Haematococcus lacustris]|uniref:Uncharacterized protein n=1 Tax=Haematococcus lacustris TaxID=44745 RepID=A0A6A0A246_HAELA|nr:uncharacterized protein HaLaN_20919 [Haematococcus lacustris]
MRGPDPTQGILRADLRPTYGHTQSQAAASDHVHSPRDGGRSDLAGGVLQGKARVVARVSYRDSLSSPPAWCDAHAWHGVAGPTARHEGFYLGPSANTSGTRTMGPDGAAVLVLTKRARACRKKLSRVQELEAASAQGKVLTSEQLPILASKPGLVAVLDELSKLEEAVREAVKEERAEARQDGFTAGLQEGQESERQRSEQELLELREQLNAERDQHAAELEAARQQHAAELEARDAEHEQKLPAAVDAAVSAAVEAVQAKPSAPDAEQLKELLREPLMKIIQLFYFSQLFDSFRNPWVAASEVPACLNYDTHLPPSEVRWEDTIGAWLWPWSWDIQRQQLRSVLTSCARHPNEWSAGTETRPRALGN